MELLEQDLQNYDLDLKRIHFLWKQIPEDPWKINFRIKTLLNTWNEAKNLVYDFETLKFASFLAKDYKQNKTIGSNLNKDLKLMFLICKEDPMYDFSYDHDLNKVLDILKTNPNIKIEQDSCLSELKCHARWQLYFEPYDFTGVNIYDATSYGQLQSKEWLVGNLSKLRLNLRKTVICGGWHGGLAKILGGDITNIDLDKNAIECSMRNGVKSLQFDMLEFDYSKFNTVINTSTEHLTELEYQNWLDLIPIGTLVIVQNNNMFHIEDHFNCCNNIQEFIDKTKLSGYFFSGKLDLMNDYERYMLIGYK